MARPGGAQTRARIRVAVRDVITEAGIDALTLDAVAQRVGVTRQAVLYHFKSRERLLAEAFLEVLEAESEALTGTADHAAPGSACARGFLTEAVDWYLADHNRFRLVYALSQVSPMLPTLDEATMRERVYPVTGRIYTALEARLAAGSLPHGVDARQLGIALHMTALGIACYAAMLDACDETFAHDWSDIADALARTIAPDS